MTDNRRGPWDAPLPNFVNTKKIAVLIHNLQLETIEYEFELDYGSYDDRKFLGRLTYFATTSGRSVETLDAEEWKRMPK